MLKKKGTCSIDSVCPVAAVEHFLSSASLIEELLQAHCHRAALRHTATCMTPKWVGANEQRAADDCERGRRPPERAGDVA